MVTDMENAPVRAPSVKPWFWRVLETSVVAAFTALGLLLAFAAPARADCAIDDAACIQFEPASGVPGSTATLWGFGAAGCGDAPASLAFVSGEFVSGATYPAVELTRSGTLDGAATFVVPRITPGDYRLRLSCDADIAYASSPFLAGTFIVLAPPETDTAPPFDPRGILVLAAAAGFAAALARFSAAARSPSHDPPPTPG